MDSPGPVLVSRRSVEAIALGAMISLAVLSRGIERLLRRLEPAAGERGAEQRKPETRRYRVYTSTSLEESLGRFEMQHEISSDEFYDRYANGDLPEGMSRHTANVWAGAWEEFRRLRDEELHADDVFRPAVAI